MPRDDVGSIVVSILLLKIAAQQNWWFCWQLDDKNAHCLASLLFRFCITGRVGDMLQCYFWDINTLFFIQDLFIAFMLMFLETHPWSMLSNAPNIPKWTFRFPIEKLEWFNAEYFYISNIILSSRIWDPITICNYFFLKTIIIQKYL